MIAKYSAAQVVGLALVVLMAVIWLAWVIRRRAAFLRRLYVPTCVIGGFAMLALGPQVLGSLTGTQGLFPPEPVRPAGAFGPRPEIVGRQPQVVQDRIGQAGRGKAHGQVSGEPPARSWPPWCPPRGRSGPAVGPEGSGQKRA